MRYHSRVYASRKRGWQGVAATNECLAAGVNCRLAMLGLALNKLQCKLAAATPGTGTHSTEQLDTDNWQVYDNNQLDKTWLKGAGHTKQTGGLKLDTFLSCITQQLLLSPYNCNADKQPLTQPHFWGNFLPSLAVLWSYTTHSTWFCQVTSRTGRVLLVSAKLLA